MSDIAASRLELLARFREMYRTRHFDLKLFDHADGYLQTTLSDEDRMPLRFFVEYNNAWWFAIITAVVVPSIGYDEESDSGSIVLDISYGDDTLRAMQHVHFKDRTIKMIRTYASPAFFARPNPLVQLDRHGNSIWLETGYDLETSRAAAEVFLDSPRGLSFASHHVTAPAIARIRTNLTELRRRS
jgi:hypothetical protein